MTAALSLRQRFDNTNDFLIGVELVTTRGTMEQGAALLARQFSVDLGRCDRVDWVSITDNAGGNPMLAPTALGKPILYGGKEVVIHLACKDFNRHGLESQAWQLATEGFHNILTLSGDYPGQGYRGNAKPVFDIDSVGLLTLLDEMNRGLGHRPQLKQTATEKQSNGTDFFCGAVVTNFKMHENEVIPQYLKMMKKLQAGAKFMIAQIGYDTRKSHELLCYLNQNQERRVPLIGNAFALSLATARFFAKGKIPGVVVSSTLLEQCEKWGRQPKRGRSFFYELAAKQIAIFRGLGFRGAYLGGVHSISAIHAILDLEESFGKDDWKQFATEILYSREGEFYLYDQDPETGLARPDRFSPDYEASDRRATHNVTLSYRLSRHIHDQVFTPGKPLYRLAKKIYSKAKTPEQGPRLLRVLEHASKGMLFDCKDCGDCSLPETGLLCPESQCAKNQRNGPCGGTRDGKCEVHDFECIWCRTYDRLKWQGRESELLDHAPVIQDQALRGTSGWANTFLGRDHQGNT